MPITFYVSLVQGSKCFFLHIVRGAFHDHVFGQGRALFLYMVQLWFRFGNVKNVGSSFNVRGALLLGAMHLKKANRRWDKHIEKNI